MRLLRHTITDLQDSVFHSTGIVGFIHYANVSVLTLYHILAVNEADHNLGLHIKEKGPPILTGYQKALNVDRGHLRRRLEHGVGSPQSKLINFTC